MQRSKKRNLKNKDVIKISNIKNIPFRFANVGNECKCVNQLCNYHDKRYCKPIK